MPMPHICQPEVLAVSSRLRLRRFQGEFEFALPWYQDRETLLLVDGKDEPYDRSRLENMYRYLDAHGELYFIELLQGQRFVPVGDVTFCQEDMPIVISPEFRHMGIGKLVVEALIARGRALGFPYLLIDEIYEYNHGSRRLFEGAGFRPCGSTPRGSRYRLELRNAGPLLSEA